jgi:hypothetical protein
MDQDHTTSLVSFGGFTSFQFPAVLAGVHG